MVYLGTALRADGRVDSELARRLGEVNRAFRSLRRVWQHAGLNRPRKVELYKAIVESEVYGLPAVWLSKAARRRRNGLQNRCFCSVYSILPAFWSRVSNARLLAITEQKQLSESLWFEQLKLFRQSSAVLKVLTSTHLRAVTE